jgi:chloramphenicol O-acetyltransferase type B
MNALKILVNIIWENVVRKFTGTDNVAQIGAYTYGIPKVSIHNNGVIIGKFCSIADDVIIVSDNHSHKKVANYPLDWWVGKFGKDTVGQKEICVEQRKISPVIIGNDVWIGAGAIILPEVKIGDGAIVGAGAVVTRDIPPYGVAVGVPARLLKYQFTHEQIQRLLEIAWWNWDIEKIAANVSIFYGDIDAFIKKFAQSNRENNVT